MINDTQKRYISSLGEEYRILSRDKEGLLRLIEQKELPEMVYNSNAIENSTLTLADTEKILLEQKMPRNISVREFFEAKNLARVQEYLRPRPQLPLTKENILRLHHLLIGGIDDDIAGRFRHRSEWVKVGRYIAPDPALVPDLMIKLLADYNNAADIYFLAKIARFHAEFESIHPFCDGNGRLGRALINLQLARRNLPPIIVQNKSKHKEYYPLFNEYQDSNKWSGLAELLAKLLLESLHKRLAYLRSQKISKLAAYARETRQNVHTLLNKARRQTIPAFRERGVWEIGV